MKRKLVLTALFFLTWIELTLGAGDHYDNTGKLNTIVACVAVILLGIVFFLFYLERRVSKMEDALDEDLEK